MSPGFTREDVLGLLRAGWDKDVLLFIHENMVGFYQWECRMLAPWAVGIRDDILVYKNYSLQQVKDVLNDWRSAPVPELVTAYCDGSGTTFNKPAGIGVYIEESGRPPILIAENIGLGTNNRAELCAVWRALRAVPDIRRHILIKTDSEYARGSLTRDWVRNANAELITNIRLDLAQRGANVCFEHVDGHAGIEGNEIADRLANIGRKLVSRVSAYEG